MVNWFSSINDIKKLGGGVAEKERGGGREKVGVTTQLAGMEATCHSTDDSPGGPKLINQIRQGGQSLNP